jgi:hypothetical protein
MARNATDLDAVRRDRTRRCHLPGAVLPDCDGAPLSARWPAATWATRYSAPLPRPAPTSSILGMTVTQRDGMEHEVEDSLP